MDIVLRPRWFASYPAGFGPAPPASELWLHHSVTRPAGSAATLAADILTVQQLERIGQQRFGGGISYTFVVTMSGRVFEGTGGLRKGSHTAGRNTRARAICWLGDFSADRPPDAMVKATAELIRYGRLMGWWTVDRLSGGHRDVPSAQTECPGDAAYACIPTINRFALNGRSGDVSLTDEQALQLDEIHGEVTKRLDNRRGPAGTQLGNGGADTVLGYAANADGMGYRLERAVHGLENRVTGLELALGQANQKLTEILTRLEGR